jgi:GNT-I family
MRRGDVRRGRQCLRPEVCRTYNFGERGSSAGQFYYRYLVPIKLNTVDVPWAKKVWSASVAEAPSWPLALNAAFSDRQQAGACALAAASASTMTRQHVANSALPLTESRTHPALTATAHRLLKDWTLHWMHCLKLSGVNPESCVKDLSRLRFEAYDADFNRSLAAAQTIGNLDEVLVPQDLHV